MPVPLPEPATKHDIRLFDADADLVRRALEAAGSHMTWHEWVRTQVRKGANDIRAKAGLPRLD